MNSVKIIPFIGKHQPHCNALKIRMVYNPISFKSICFGRMRHKAQSTKHKAQSTKHKAQSKRLPRCEAIFL
ncbi:hypothetical protein EAT43_14670 [Vibrio parahaemolyticus]|nr:hypothetical protein [Vibrio parahaemolyticus]EGR1333569.1 hypothetical protein [Vibrio parahaemolyticus]